MNKKKLALGLAASVALAITLVRCGKASSSTDLLIAAPAVYISSGMGSTTREGDGEVPSEKPPNQAFQDAKDFFKKTPDQLKTEAGDLDKKKEFRAICFGPAWSDNATGANTDRPPGDTGMVYATIDNVSTTACAAGQMRALVGNRSKDVEKIKGLVALVLSTGGSSGAALPTTVGGKVTVTGVPTPIGVTITKSELELAAKDTAGNPVYKITVTGTAPGGKTISVVALHKPTNADNTEFEGRINAIFPHTATMGGTGTQRGMAVTYQQTATNYSFVLEAMGNRSTTDVNFFTSTTGRIDFASLTANREDLIKMIATFNRTTQAGTVHFAWMAGGGDQAWRTFHVTTSGRTDGATGTGYFGYVTSAAPLSDNPGGASIWAAGMRCNWKNDMGTEIPKIQKQTMTFTGGTFIPAVNNIAFAPTSTCDKAANWNVTVGPTFLTGVHTEGVAPTNNLLTTYTASSIPQVSPPTVTLSR